MPAAESTADAVKEAVAEKHMYNHCIKNDSKEGLGKEQSTVAHLAKC